MLFVHLCTFKKKLYAFLYTNGRCIMFIEFLDFVTCQKTGDCRPVLMDLKQTNLKPTNLNPTH